MSFRFMARWQGTHAVARLSRAVGVTRAGYYAWKGRGPAARSRQDGALAARIRAIFAASHATYGVPRIHAELRQAHGIQVGRKRVARLMRTLGLAGISRRRARRRTTVPDPAAAPAPDLVQRRFQADQPNQLWVADLTYIPTAEGWLYLAVIVDACSRAVVGWAMRADLKAELVVAAVRMAITRRRPAAGLIHHSDRGSQYTSLACGRTLRASRLVASMGARGDAFDNAACESFFATLKTEWLNRQRWPSHAQARQAVFRYIETFYNPRRRHSALGYRSPLDYEMMLQRRKEDQAAA